MRYLVAWGVLAGVALGLLLAGCGASLPTPREGTVLAAAKPSCSQAGCSGRENTPWGYCLWQTEQTGKTFLMWLEIGIKKEQGDGGARCTVPLPAGGNIATLTGNVDYRPLGRGMSSMVARIGTCCASEEYLWAGKMTAMPPTSSIVPINATYPHPLPATQLVIVFYDDEAKPTQIHIGVAGTFQ